MGGFAAIADKARKAVGVAMAALGTARLSNDSELRRVVAKFDWTNAQVVALGAALTGNISIGQIPANAVATCAYIVIDTQAAGVATLTVSLGRQGAAFTDYVAANNAKVAANTVYGASSINDVPVVAAAQTVNLQFVSSGSNLDQVTTCTGHLYLEYIVFP